MIKSREARELERQISLVRSQAQAETRRLDLMYQAQFDKLTARIEELERDHGTLPR